MAAKKTLPQKIEILSRLDYDQCVEVLSQFEQQHAGMRQRQEFLGISVAMEGGAMVVKVTVTQMGEAKFVEAMQLPKEFEARFPTARASLKVLIKAAPILTSAAPKSAAGKKTAPVFPVGSSGH